MGHAGEDGQKAIRLEPGVQECSLGGRYRLAKALQLMDLPEEESQEMVADAGYIIMTRGVPLVTGTSLNTSSIPLATGPSLQYFLAGHLECRWLRLGLAASLALQ